VVLALEGQAMTTMQPQPKRTLAVLAILAVGEVWSCTRCGRTLGIVRGDRVDIAYHKRLISAMLPCEQYCDRCEMWNRVDIDMNQSR
jgi:hypothetical protein